MDQTLQALGVLLLQAVPTILFFIILTVYLKYVFFRPIAKIFEERRKATEGVRELARQAFEAADRKTSEFEHALQLARAQIHQEHEELRRRWTQEQEERVAQARAEADQKIEEAKRAIAEEVERVQAELDNRVEALSDRMLDTLLARRAA
jgi:F0F1-type ATP synthase membrane subunit b/b'